MSLNAAGFIAFAGSLARLPSSCLRTCPSSSVQSAVCRFAKMSAPNHKSALVSAAKLAEELDHRSTAPLLLDATWYMPGPNRKDPAAEFDADHLPGALRFDIDAPGLAAVSHLPHMMPSLEDPADVAAVTKLVPSLRPLVVYAQGAPEGMSGFVASARAWFHLRAMGHPDVRVLDGGLWKFRQQGFKHSNESEAAAEPVTADASFKPKLHKQLVWDLHDVVTNSKEPRATLVDARPEGRFDGSIPEPREGLNSGHVPGSFSLPASACVDLKSGLMKPRSELAALLQEREIPVGKLAVTCGSGVTAAVVALALYELGHTDVPLYDGSWAEYGGLGLHVAIER